MKKIRDLVLSNNEEIELILKLSNVVIKIPPVRHYFHCNYYFTRQCFGQNGNIFLNSTLYRKIHWQI